MQNIIKLKGYSSEGDSSSARKDVYFNVEGFVTVTSGISGSNPGSEMKIIFLPSHSVADGAYGLTLTPGKNLVTQNMVDGVEEAIIENSVNPLAIADLQTLIEPVSEYSKITISELTMPEITS